MQLLNFIFEWRDCYGWPQETGVHGMVGDRAKLAQGHAMTFPCCELETVRRAYQRPYRVGEVDKHKNLQFWGRGNMQDMQMFARKKM